VEDGVIPSIPLENRGLPLALVVPDSKHSHNCLGDSSGRLPTAASLAAVSYTHLDVYKRQSEAHFDDLFFARGQRAQDLAGLIFQVYVDDGLGGGDHGAVFDEIAKV